MDHYQPPVAASTYLTKIAFEQRSRVWIRRTCDVLVSVETAADGAGTGDYCQLRLHMISEFGMVASVSCDLPDNFRLLIGAERHQIDCAIMHRQDGRAHIRFLREQPEAFVNFVASRTDLVASLEEINPAGHGPGEGAA